MCFSVCRKCRNDGQWGVFFSEKSKKESQDHHEIGKKVKKVIAKIK